MSTRADATTLPWRVFFPLLLAMFAIAVGYGFLLPILPRLLERIAATADPATLSRHTGLLSGTYTLSLFLFAPLWGRIADRRGRRLAILVGLTGFATTLGLFATVNSLPFLYLERALGGLFASAIAPAVYALVGDYAPSKEWRARRFALLNIAGATGFFIGPMLGSLTMRRGHFSNRDILDLARCGREAGRRARLADFRCESRSGSRIGRRRSSVRRHHHTQRVLYADRRRRSRGPRRKRAPSAPSCPGSVQRARDTRQRAVDERGNY
ncbi:MFS transporter [Burkholderia diffusa]|uniref:MFS transporter n=1 Tax=Burkholderia diffusa TaxID=488732 RepID=UPI001FC7C442|nr:MFS transporter [Burkholderia diffusa]